MTNAQSPVLRMLTGLLPWIVGVPVLSVVIALIAERGNVGLAGAFAFISVGVMRFMLGGTDRGLGWLQLPALACACAIALTSLFGAQSYVAFRGERVDAVVAKQISAVEHRLADPVTNEDLGVLTGRRKDSGPGRAGGFYQVGDTVAVLVIRNSGLKPLPVESRGRATTMATILLLSWLGGLVLRVVVLAHRSRAPQAG